MDVLTFEQFFKMRQLAGAFSIKDITAAGVMFTWMLSLGYTLEQVHQFILFLPRVYDLERMGYFEKRPDVRHAKEIREFEKKLPKELRKMFRKTRLANTSYSGVQSPGGKSGSG